MRQPATVDARRFLVADPLWSLLSAATVTSMTFTVKAPG
jgi:hypothetical protein